MAKLTILEGENQGVAYSFDDEEVILGRSQDATLVIKDLRSSRKHARIVKIKEDFYLEDLGSQNGTLLNGKKTQKAKLQDHDAIKIGSTLIEFLLVETPLVGNVFCGYKILQKLVDNEPGTMYVAEQTSLKREVLLWVLPFGLVGEEANHLLQAQRLFFQQISALTRLFHPNLLMVMDFSATSQYWYCAFEKVDLSSNINSYLKENPSLSIDKIVEIASQVAAGLKYAHDNHLLHLHLTSKNVVLQKGQAERIVLTELGVAKFLSETTVGSLTKATGVFGISEYVSPEQISGNMPVSEKTDIYSFGCLLYHLLSKTIPFTGKHTSEALESHLRHQIVPLTQYRNDIPVALEILVEQCMSKNIASRPDSFETILKKLKEIQKEREWNSVWHSKQGKKIVQKHLGQKIPLKWWLLFPFLGLLAGAFVFFLVPWILG